MLLPQQLVRHGQSRARQPRGASTSPTQTRSTRHIRRSPAAIEPQRSAQFPVPEGSNGLRHSWTPSPSSEHAWCGPWAFRCIALHVFAPPLGLRAWVGSHTLLL